MCWNVLKWEKYLKLQLPIIKLQFENQTKDLKVIFKRTAYFQHFSPQPNGLYRRYFVDHKYVDWIYKWIVQNTKNEFINKSIIERIPGLIDCSWFLTAIFSKLFQRNCVVKNCDNQLKSNDQTKTWNIENIKQRQRPFRIHIKHSKMYRNSTSNQVYWTL